MRKVNSKGTLQPNTSGNGSQIGMSPSTIKPHSMMKLYKVQTGNTSLPSQAKQNFNIQPSTIIAKTIQARRMQQQNINTNQPSTLQNRTNHNITMLFGQDQNNNNSVQTVKPTSVFSPGETILRKNNDLSNIGCVQTGTQKLNYSQWDKQSPLSRQKLFNGADYNSVGTGGTKTTELYNNMRKQLEKQRSLQTLFNTTQKIQSQNTYRPQQQQQQMPILTHVVLQQKTSRNNLQQSNTADSSNQRAVIKRGSKYQGNLSSTGIIKNGSGFIAGGHHSSQNSMINNSNFLNNSQRSATSNHLNHNAGNYQSSVGIGLGSQISQQNQQSQNTSNMFMFKNNLSTLTRNKSAFINFNSTQPVQLQNSVVNNGNPNNLSGNGHSGQGYNSHVNKTQIDLRSEGGIKKVQIVKNKLMIHKESPSVSSDEEKKEKIKDSSMNKENSTIKDFNVNVIQRQQVLKLEVQKMKQIQGSHQKKRSQLPNGSFIETKMKNCLHSRNADHTSQAYQTYQGALNQKAILTKNQSQPNLNHQKNMNLTQRTTFVKTSFLRHDDSRSVTPINQTQSKSPNAHSTHDKISTKSKTKPIVGLKGDMKSLNLSPIVPQNLGKNQQQFQREPSHSDYQKANNIASAQKRLEMRKQSVQSNQNNQNQSKPFSSLKKERSIIDINKPQSIKDEPTTEKKQGKQNQTVLNAMKYNKPGYSSQETERGPGGTNSYSTADDINLVSNESHSHYVLRFKNENGSQSRKMFQNDKSKQYQGQFTDAIAIQEESIHLIKKPPVTQNNLFNKIQESKIKVNQILNNNNLTQNSNRYNLNITPEQIFLPDTHMIKTNTHNTANKPAIINPTNKTPRALPYLNNDDTLNYDNLQKGGFNNTNKIIIPLIADQVDDEQVTQKKKPKYEENQSDSSFDDDEDQVDAKDFEEFDRAERSHDSQNSLKIRVQIIEQDSLFRDLKVAINKSNGSNNNNNNHNAFNNYNHAVSNLNNANNYQPFQIYDNQKDDRNSLVNYDTSLLTHNTGRDNNSSPISDIRENRAHKQKQANIQNLAGQQQQQNLLQNHQKQQFYQQSELSGLYIDTNSFLMPTLTNNNDQTLDMIDTTSQIIKEKEVKIISNKAQNNIHQYHLQDNKQKKIYCDDNLFEVYKEDQHEKNAAIYKQIMIKLQKDEELELEKVTSQTLSSQKYRLIKNDRDKAKYLQNQLTNIRNKYKQLLIDKVLAQQ